MEDTALACARLSRRWRGQFERPEDLYGYPSSHLPSKLHSHEKDQQADESVERLPEFDEW